MKIFVCANLKKEKTKEIFPRVIRELKVGGFVALMEKRLRGDCGSFDVSEVMFGEWEENARQCDFFLTIGGDGTILRWGKKAAVYGKPLVGVNTGRLGFMATLEADGLSRLSQLKGGNYGISRRMMLDVAIKTDKGKKEFRALNDVVLFKGTTSKLPEYLVFSGEREVTRVRADGLIISTPTGSTAYSLSAGGPIIDPKLCCFEVTALSPHTLFNRPMLFDTEKPLRAEYLAYENSSVFVTVDGGEPIGLSQGDSVLIERSELKLKLVDFDEDSFFGSVNNKLMQPLK